MDIKNQIETKLCGRCGQCFRGEKELEKHNEDVHSTHYGITSTNTSKVEIHLCRRCGRCFQGKPMLLIHNEKVHPELAPRRKYCFTCNFSTTSKHTMKAHNNKFHGGSREEGEYGESDLKVEPLVNCWSGHPVSDQNLSTNDSIDPIPQQPIVWTGHPISEHGFEIKNPSISTATIWEAHPIFEN